MNRFIRWILSSLAYLFYTVAVILLLLWWRFPADSVRKRLVHELNTTQSAWLWRIGSLEASLPPGIELGDMRLATRENPDLVLFEADSVRLRPDIRRLTGLETIPFRYTIRTMGGTVRGRTLLHLKTRRITGEETFEGLNLAALTGLRQKLRRPLSGSMSGTCTYDMALADPLRGTMRMDVRVANGFIGLRQPVFGLDQLDFSETTVSLDYADRLLTFARGRLDAKLLGADYSGTLALRSPLFMSELKLSGTIEPRPELLGRLQDTTVVTLIKSQLQSGRLAFNVSGTLLEPGIQFTGASGVLDGIIQGSGR